MELIVKWKIKASEARWILGLLAELSKRTKLEAGNVLYEIYQSETDPNELFLHERYTDAAAFEAHRNSEHYQRIVIGQIVPHLEVREVNYIKKIN